MSDREINKIIRKYNSDQSVEGLKELAARSQRYSLVPFFAGPNKIDYDNQFYYWVIFIGRSPTYDIRLKCYRVAQAKLRGDEIESWVLITEGCPLDTNEARDDWDYYEEKVNVKYKTIASMFRQENFYFIKEVEHSGIKKEIRKELSYYQFIEENKTYQEIKAPPEILDWLGMLG